MRDFFAAVRPMFRRGRMTDEQVRGLEAMVNQGIKCSVLRSHLAYVLATAFHETGQRCWPVREGYARSNEGAIRAVTGLFDKGIIDTNYALPDPETGESYYGRGLVQITWRENYEKLGKVLGIDLVRDPDRALDLVVAIDCLFTGMAFGMYRKNLSLAMIPEKPNLDDFTKARGMINGDVRKNGKKIAHYAAQFYDALESIYAPAA